MPAGRELVALALAQARDEDLPDAVGVMKTHRVAPAVPAVDVAHDTHALARDLEPIHERIAPVGEQRFEEPSGVQPLHRSRSPRRRGGPRTAVAPSTIARTATAARPASARGADRARRTGRHALLPRPRGSRRGGASYVAGRRRHLVLHFVPIPLWTCMFRTARPPSKRWRNMSSSAC